MDALACVGIVIGTFVALMSGPGDRRWNAVILIGISVFVLICY